MTNIIVMNRENAKKYSYEIHDETSVIISIYDTTDSPNHFNKYINNGIKAVLYVQFDDVDKTYIDNKNNIYNIAIDETNAHKIVNFAKMYWNKVNTIIVHCGAGVSRSAACAAAISKYFTGSDDFIFDNFKYRPNMMVYRTVLNEFFNEEN